MIGIGVTSYKRPELLEQFIKQVNLHTKDFVIYVAKDIPSIAKAKNECIYNLKDCDHIFLFDDDCFPVADGWTDYFINSGLDHSCFMDKRHHPIFKGNIYTIYNDASGVFLHLTKEVVEQVGYFNTKYDRYGFEHAAYSHRINKAGLSKARFLCLNDANKYLRALDFEGGNKSTITEEEKNEYYKKNNPIYINETSISKIYYEYTPNTI